MSIKEFMIENKEAIKELIAKLPGEKFDSHQFLKLFMKRFEPDYVRFLGKYKKQSHRIVNSQIARNLYSMIELNIQKKSKVRSETVFGNKVENQQWLKNK